MKKEYQVEFQVHYFLNQEGLHTFNAFQHNICEKQLLQSLKIIAAMANCRDLTIELKPSQEGGWKDRITIGGSVASLLVFVSAYIPYFFSPAVDKNVDTKNLVEIAEKIAEGKFTEEEVGILVAGNERLEAYASLYYKNLKKEPRVVKVEGQVINPESKKVICTSTINQKDFDTHIVNRYKSKIDIKGTTIQIISPILVDAKSFKWRGKYSGDVISFDLKDNDFITQVHNRDVLFESGTSIKCDLQIDQTIIEKGPMKKVKNSYTVTQVYSWEDGNHMQTEAKKYGKMEK